MDDNDAGTRTCDVDEPFGGVLPVEAATDSFGAVLRTGRGYSGAAAVGGKPEAAEAELGSADVAADG